MSSNWNVVQPNTEIEFGVRGADHSATISDEALDQLLFGQDYASSTERGTTRWGSQQGITISPDHRNQKGTGVSDRAMGRFTLQAPALASGSVFAKLEQKAERFEQKVTEKEERCNFARDR